MKRDFESLLVEVQIFGEVNDSQITERAKRMLNITPDTGEFLAALIGATQAKNILEIGTSNGYSTLWLANVSSEIGGHVTTIEKSEFKTEMARANFEKFELSSFITQKQEDALTVLAAIESSSVDLLFLDSERYEYLAMWPEIDRVIKPHGVLVMDNAISHESEVEEFVAVVKGSRDYWTCLVPVGKGEFVAVKKS